MRSELELPAPPRSDPHPALIPFGQCTSPHGSAPGITETTAIIPQPQPYRASLIQNGTAPARPGTECELNGLCSGTIPARHGRKKGSEAAQNAPHRIRPFLNVACRAGGIREIAFQTPRPNPQPALAPREPTPWQSGRGTHCSNSPGGCHTRVWRLGRGE